MLGADRHGHLDLSSCSVTMLKQSSNSSLAVNVDSMMFPPQALPVDSTQITQLPGLVFRRDIVLEIFAA